ncbi:MAG: hypothetical protein ACTSXH_17700 [Promethearchaeota archaeon]
MREIRDLGMPCICQHLHHERVYFQCTEYKEIFTLEHPLIPIGTRFITGVIGHAITRVLKKRDSIKGCGKI